MFWLNGTSAIMHARMMSAAIIALRRSMRSRRTPAIGPTRNAGSTRKIIRPATASVLPGDSRFVIDSSANSPIQSPMLETLMPIHRRRKLRSRRTMPYELRRRCPRPRAGRARTVRVGGRRGPAPGAVAAQPEPRDEALPVRCPASPRQLDEASGSGATGGGTASPWRAWPHDWQMPPRSSSGAIVPPHFGHGSSSGRAPIT